MLFNSVPFLLFFAVVTALFFSVPQRAVPYSASRRNFLAFRLRT